MLRKIPHHLSRSIFQKNKLFFSIDVADIVKKKDFEKQLFENYDINDIDTSNIVSSFAPQTGYETLDIISKLSYLRPTNLYLSMDQLTSDSIFYVANQLGWGVAGGIIAVSLVVKLVFMPFMIAANLNAIKMKLIEPEMKNFQSLMSSLQKSRDFQAVKETREQFMELREKHKISSMLPFLSILQFPCLTTLFFCVRYISTVPDKYPEVLNGGFLWFKDLTVADPYCILPVISAFMTYMNISLNPSMNLTQSSTFGYLARYVKYFKYMPFFSIPFAIFFPAGMSFYWCVVSAAHLGICTISRSNLMRKIANIPKFLPGTILERMNQKNNPKIVKAVYQDRNIADIQKGVETVKVYATREEAKAASHKKNKK